MKGEKAVILEIEKSIKNGNYLANFRLNTDESKWIEGNKEKLKDMGYKIDFYMGRLGTVEVKWEDVD